MDIQRILRDFETLSEFVSTIKSFENTSLKILENKLAIQWNLLPLSECEVATQALSGALTMKSISAPIRGRNCLFDVPNRHLTRVFSAPPLNMYVPNKSKLNINYCK